MATLLKQIFKLQFIEDKDAAFTKDWPPIRKLRYQLFAGFLVTAIVAIAKHQNIEIPEEAQETLQAHALELVMAGMVVYNFVIGYWTKPRRGETTNVAPREK